jgi:hypothetical protein
VDGSAQFHSFGFNIVGVKFYDHAPHFSSQREQVVVIGRFDRSSATAADILQKVALESGRALETADLNKKI